MDPFSLLQAVLGIGGTVGGLAQSWGTREDLKRSLAPGGMPGTLTPQQSAGVGGSFFQDRYGNTPEAAALSGQFQQGLQNVPGFAMVAAQNVEDQAARGRQTPYADEALNQVRGGALGKAEKSAGDLVTRNPEVIDQATYDRMVSQFFDQNNAAAASRSRQIDDTATAGNISPDALAALRVMSSEENAAQNSGASRDLSVQRQLENRKGLERAIQLAGSTGQAYNQQLGAALSDRASLEQPMDFASLGALIGQDSLMKLMLQQESGNAFANQLLGIGGSGMQGWTADRNSRRMADSMGGGLFGGRGGGQLGSGIAAGGALAATGLGAPMSTVMPQFMLDQALLSSILG